MTRKLTFLILALFALIAGPGAEAWGQEKADTYERLTSIANIDESAQYVLGIDGTGFHYEGTSSWGKTALPSAQTPLYYTLKKAADGQSFTAQTEISNTTYYLQVPTSSNTFGMATSTGTNTDLIIGTTLSDAGDGANYAVTNKSTTTRHIRRNGDSGLRSYASTTGAIAFFYKVVKDEKTLVSIAISGTPTKTTYEVGESFDPAGLVVTGTYSEGDPEVITSGITWTVTPSGALIVGTTSVSVTATVGEITSSAYPVNVTVTAPLPKITITKTNSGITTSYNNGTFTLSDVTFAYTQWMSSTDFIQAKASQSPSLQNTTAIHGKITKIQVVTGSGKTPRAVTVKAGTTSTVADMVSITSPTTSMDMVFDFGETNYTYFCLSTPGNACYFDKIVITYEATTNPVINVESTEVNLAYNETSGSIPYSITNSVEGKALTAALKTGNWINNLAVDATNRKVTFTASANTTHVERTATITLSYDGADDKDVTVTQNGIPYTLTLSSNGVVNEPQPVQGSITLSDPTNIPTGFTFAGWTTDESNTQNLISNGSYTPSADVTLYAVFSREEGGIPGNYEKVTEDLDDWSGEYLMVYENEEDEENIEVDIAWNGTDAANCYVPVNITDGIISEKPSNAVSISIAAMRDSQGYSIRVNGGVNNGKYINGKVNNNAADNGLLFVDEPCTNTISIDDNYDIQIVNGTKGQIMRFNSTSDQLRFRFYKPTTTGDKYNLIQLYRKNAGTPGVTKYYTRVYNEDTELASLTVAGPSIILSGKTLTVTGDMSNDNASDLIIEDGAQLIHSSENVMATVRKSITAHGTTGGWNFIASPIAEDLDPISDMVGMIPEELEGFDLYLFDQTKDYEWQNYYIHYFDIANGQGYLYANAANTTLEFAGTLYNGNGVFPLTNSGNGKFAGWNLVGNPFPYNAYASQAYFTLNSDGSAVNAETSNGAIAPCTAVFVQATGENPSVTFSKDAPARSGSLQISLAQANTKNASRIDNAIVSFGEGQQLEKLYMFGDGSSLYIPQGDKEYAIVSAETEGTLPLNFEVKENGTYTITVNTENLDAEYLHLIDNMTGMDVDLLTTDSYTFEAKDTDYTSRFKLVFDVKNEASAGSDSNFAYMSDGNLVISDIEGQATLQIVDMMGRVVSTETVSGNYCKALNLKAGVYVLNLNGMTQKIVVE